ncbi:MAG: peptidoglycan-binding domain-containing protein [Minisyncoccia bacterium]
MNKKTIVSALIAGVMVLSPILAMAQTSTSTQVSSMLAQIEALKVQIQALQSAQAQLQTAQMNIKSTLGLIRNLKQGMSGDDVRALQAILASDSSIYPEGVISGFYGRLTAEAVKKFQKKNGFESVGNVGPKTLKRLNEMLNSLGLSEEEDEDDDDKDNNRGEKRLCIKVAPGHLIASGWLKKNDRPLVPECQRLPPGIKDKNKGNSVNSTTTPFLVTQASSGVQVGGMIFDTAKLMFGNNPTGSITFQVYGPGDTTCSSPLSPALPTVNVNGNGMYTSGNFTTSATGTYKFIATYSGDSKNYSVKNSCGDPAESVLVTTVSDTSAPQILGVGTTNLLGTTTSVVWTTNELANSKIWYGTTTPITANLNHSSTRMQSDSGMVLSHTLNLSGLATSTTYYYIVVSSDASGNTATSTPEGLFTTSIGL